MKWSKNKIEMEKLERLWESASRKELHEAYPNRTWLSIKNKAEHEGYKRLICDGLGNQYSKGRIMLNKEKYVKVVMEKMRKVETVTIN